MAQPTLSHRLMRALFVGVGVGLFASAGVFLMCQAVNILAGAIVVDPIAFLLLVLGGSMFSSLGAEWSSDIREMLKESEK